MFNSHPIIQRVPIGNGAECIVVDNILSDPQRMVAGAVANREAFSFNPANHYPGIEKKMPAEFDQRLEEYFSQHLKQPFQARRTLGINTRMSIVTSRPEDLTPPQRICHRDAHSCAEGEGACAAVLYLFDDARLGGTSFYRPLVSPEEIDYLLHQARVLDRDSFSKVIGAQPEYFNSVTRYFEKTATIPAAWNRAIFYDATVFHSGQIDVPELMHAHPGQGRLTINAFLRYRKSAA
jgi:hypothetical protein